MRHTHTPDAPRPPRPSAPAPAPVVAPDTRQSLLDLARVAVAVATRTADVTALDRALRSRAAGTGPGAVFVTLTEDGVLRGCIGSLDHTRDLREAVVAAGLSAALDDPRFLPLTATELPATHIDISVLGLPVPLTDPDAFRPGIDGVIVERDGRRGLLLPEVATEQGWGAAQMLGAVCRKARLPADAWRDQRTRLQVFRTCRFGGPATRTH